MEKEYRVWLENCRDEQLLSELRSIEGKDAEIQDRFYTELQFGTAGLRGILGAGTNRMNIYTVGRATKGFAAYLNSHSSAPRVAISYDNRRNSELFARYAAAVMASRNVEVFIYRELMPTPMLSWAVREKKCDGGVMVTASHNPAAYNGYKAYGPDGCQLTDEAASEVEKAIALEAYFDDSPVLSFQEALDSGKVHWIEDKLIDDYLDMIAALAPGDPQEAAGLKIVYTPLNGTGRMPVLRTLERAGFSQIRVVPEQEYPDPDFTTCPYPNPEIREALLKGMALMEETGADLLLATDPDADRVGTACWDNGQLRLITGNEMGVLMLDYLCAKRVREGTMPKKPVAVKTIVTTDMARICAEHYGVEMRDVLTGFKYIGDQIAQLEQEGHPERFILGFEESYGYLSGVSVRDKDAVNASLVICRMCAELKKRGMTLADALRDAEGRFGAFRNAVENHAFPGEDGMIQMNRMMTSLRENPPMELMGIPLVRLQDYYLRVDKDLVGGEKTPITLPQSNVLKFYYGADITVVVRPSGTEPKLKIYHAIRGKTPEEAQSTLARWQESYAAVTKALKEGV